MNKKFGKYFSVVASLWLVSCGSSKDRPQLKIDTVSIYTALDANQDSATAVDLVIVHDQELLKTLGKLSAKAYFKASPQLRLDNPTLLNIWHWELVPGQSVVDFTPTQDKGRAFGAYVFANYLAPGAHRLKVAPDGVVAVMLGKNDLKDASTLSAKDMNSGETMTNPDTLKSSSDGKEQKGQTLTDTSSSSSCEGIFSQETSQEVVPEAPQKGPVTPPPSKPKTANPCKKGSVCPQSRAVSPYRKGPVIITRSVAPTAIPSAPSCIGRKQIPIVVKPLRPLKVNSPCTLNRR